METKKSCFVICPIGDPNSETRKWSDDILENIITPVVLECGYSTPIRADQIVGSEIITVDIFKHLIEDNLVIADLTDSNANVFYELAIRHAAKKPCVTLIKNGQQNPFDIFDLRTIPIHTHIKIAQKAKKDLKEYILDAEKKGENAITPILKFVNIITLTQGQTSLSERDTLMMKVLADLSTSIMRIDSKVSSLQSQINSLKPKSLAEVLQGSEGKTPSGVNYARLMDFFQGYNAAEK